MHKTLVISFILTKAVLCAQPTIQWQKCYGGSALDSPHSMVATSDGGYVVIGTTGSVNGDIFGNHGATDWWALKINASGAKQWQKTFGGTDLETLYAVKQTPDEGFILAGYTLSNNGNVSGNHGDYDYWVVKLSKTGAIEWQKTYGGSGDDKAYDVILCSDGGYMIAGHSASLDGDRSTYLGNSDFWILKTDSSGKILWEKSYGGSSTEFAYSISPANDGGYVVIGETFSNDGDVAGFHGNDDCWILKIDSLGAKEWQKTLGGTFSDIGIAAIQSSEGNFIVAAQASSPDGDVEGHKGHYDFWVICLSPSGNILWKKTFGGSMDDSPLSIGLDIDGNYLIGGISSSTDGDVQFNDGNFDAWIIKVDKSGSLIWQQTYGGSNLEIASKILPTNDGGYIFTGETYSNDGDVQGNHGSVDFWVVKLSGQSSPVEDIAARTLNIFPNPTQNTAQIQLPTQTRPIALRLFDTFGKEVLHWADFPVNGILDLKHLPTGLYWAQVIDLEENRFSGKILKK